MLCSRSSIDRLSRWQISLANESSLKGESDGKVSRISLQGTPLLTDDDPDEQTAYRTAVIA